MSASIESTSEFRENVSLLRLLATDRDVFVLMVLDVASDR